MKTKHIIVQIAACAVVWILHTMPANAADAKPTVQVVAPPAAILSWPGESIDTWNTYKRHLITINGRVAWVIEPKKALPGNTWAWCMEFPEGYIDSTVLQLLEKGFYYLHINVGNTFGCPKALKHFDAFYTAITAKGLARKGTLIGMSRGGLYAYNWASQDPAHPCRRRCGYAGSGG
ncbi:MAG: hypothetical protein V1899_02500 [Planctomycetota bacterium]